MLLRVSLLLFILAATRALGDEGSAELPAVGVTGHYDNTVGAFDAASEGSVSGAMLQDIPLLRPAEVLETVPGLVVTQHSGDGKANQYFLRGYNLDHGHDLASFVDGVPVNMPSNAHGQGYSDLNFLIPELVDRINYYKGPYFADRGDFSAAGTVDIHYRDSLPEDFVSLTLGQDAYRRILVASSKPLGDSSPEGGPVLLSALEVLRENGPFVVPEDLHKTNALLRLSAGSAIRGWSLEGQFYDTAWNSTDQVPLSLISSGVLPRYGAVDPTDGGNTGREILSAEWHERNDPGYRKFSAFAEHYRLRLWSDFTLFENRESLAPLPGNPTIYAPNPLIPTDQFEQFEQRNIIGAAYVEGWNHTLAGRTSVTEAGILARVDFIHVGLQDTQRRVAFATVSDNQIRETGIGAWLQNTTVWTPWFRSLVGLREQAVGLSQTDTLNDQNTGSARAQVLLPKLALVFGPWARSEFFINAGRGFHSNDARGVINQVDPTTGGAATPVPALVRATGYEIGARTEAIDGLQSSLALWVLNSDSELVYNADSDIGSTHPNGASRRYGVEWNNHLVVGRHLLFDADLAWTHARYRDENANGAAGHEIPNAVPRVALVRATAKALGAWSATIEERYIGAYPASQDGSIAAPSSLMTNLRIQRVLTPEIKLSVDLLNVLDTHYYDILYDQDYRSSPTGPVVLHGASVHPGEPRELRLAVNVGF